MASADKKQTYSKQIIEVADMITRNSDKEVSIIVSEIVKKYQKSERTVWRWIKKAQEYNVSRVSKEKRKEKKAPSPNKIETDKGGRPSSFNKEYVNQAFNYSLPGATDKDMAVFFGVSEQTLNSWKKKHPEFLESLKKGKEQADAEIASRLFHRAKGAIITTQQAFKTKFVTYNDKGQRIETESIEVVSLLQEQPPDTTAAIFWLKNRNPSNWRDKVNTDITTNGKDIKSDPLIIEVIDSRDKVDKDVDAEDTDNSHIQQN